MTSSGLAIRVISLRESAERRALVQENLGDCPLPWAFLDASEPDDPGGLETGATEQEARFGRTLTSGEVACFQSHARALHAFDDDPDLRWLIVLEDDVWLDTKFPFGELTGWLDAKSIGFLRLYAREWRRAFARYRFGERQVLYLASDPHGAQGYMISRDAAARLRLRLRLQRVARPFDDELGRFWENGLDNHLLFPFPIIERHLTSTLIADRETAGRAGRRLTPGRFWTRAKDFLRKRAYLAWRLSPLAPDRIRLRKR